jgi:TPR repeat protein
LKLAAAVLLGAIMIFSVVNWWHKPTDQGDSYAQYNLGNAYYSGEGVEKDYKEAVIWWRKSADQGYAVAQYGLGNAYYNGDGVEKDYKEAIRWWRKAADQGYVTAQLYLGDAYHNGYGVEKNDKEAIGWWRKAADQGDAVAQLMLENMQKTEANDNVNTDSKVSPYCRPYKTPDGKQSGTACKLPDGTWEIKTIDGEKKITD